MKVALARFWTLKRKLVDAVSLGGLPGANGLDLTLSAEQNIKLSPVQGLVWKLSQTVTEGFESNLFFFFGFSGFLHLILTVSFPKPSLSCLLSSRRIRQLHV